MLISISQYNDWAADWRSEFRFSAGPGIFLFAIASTPPLVPTQPSNQWLPGAVFPGVNFIWRRNYVFLAWCFIKYRVYLNGAVVKQTQGYHWLFPWRWGGRGVGLATHLHLVPRSGSAWSCASTPPIRLHGVVLCWAQGQLHLFHVLMAQWLSKHRDSFTFALC
jgi:hypothetical protein